MSEEEAIDRVLEFLYDKDMEYLEEYCRNELDYVFTRYEHLFDKMVDEGFIKPTKNSDAFARITPRGRDMVKGGGYLKHIKEKEEEYNRDQERKAIELNLAKSNIEANENQKKWASKNWKATVVNIVIGLLNAAALAYQLFKD